MTSTVVKSAAVEYWQDKLAKFFPTSGGPTGTELDMFLAGVEWAKHHCLCSKCLGEEDETE